MHNVQYVRNTKTGVVFVATPFLTQLDYMEPCTKDGAPLIQFVDDDAQPSEEPVPKAAVTDPVLR